MFKTLPCNRELSLLQFHSNLLENENYIEYAMLQSINDLLIPV